MVKYHFILQYEGPKDKQQLFKSYIQICTDQKIGTRLIATVWKIAIWWQRLSDYNILAISLHNMIIFVFLILFSCNIMLIWLFMNIFSSSFKWRLDLLPSPYFIEHLCFQMYQRVMLRIIFIMSYLQSSPTKQNSSSQSLSIDHFE